MSDLQSSLPSAGPVPVMLDATPVSDDPDFAFGCECADPSLQIAQWMQDARASGAEA